MTEIWGVRAPTTTDADALGDLKIEWSAVGYEPTSTDRAEFRRTLAEWMSRLGDSLVCRIAVADGRLIGMAWMVVYERVPNFDANRRLSGDIQSVYVAPELRGRGIGAQLLASVCAEADQRGIQRITVHSTGKAIPLYRRAGFQNTENLLVRTNPSAPNASAQLPPGAQ